jgi:Arc/MetJ-type ribon-helix-helix transcriptional regulator
MATKKITVNLPEEQVKFLQEISAREHISFTDALRRAINSEQFFVQQETAGRKILIEAAGQGIREVIRK